MLYRNSIKLLVACFSAATALSPTCEQSFSAETTQYGAVVIRAASQEEDPAPILPEVVFSKADQEIGWKLVPGEAYSGVDSHRFFLTVEAPKVGLEPPIIEVVWPNVNIERVIGARGDYEIIDNGVRFTPGKAKAPTGAFTEISFGAVRLGVFHNWDVRRCGPYRDGRYPREEIKAQLNYMLAALEVCRAYGWTETDKPDFVDHINLYGFETLFTNGHRDFPPHFHIMLAWDGWAAANVGHYLLDSQGNIVKNSYWVLHEDVEKPCLPGDVSRYTDKTSRDVFDTVILSDGSGLTFSKVGASKEYLLRAGERGAPESVEVLERATGTSDEWKKLCEVVANDDAEHGEFHSKAFYVDGSIQSVEFEYDPDTGAKR